MLVFAGTFAERGEYVATAIEDAEDRNAFSLIGNFEGDRYCFAPTNGR